jgi:hypothetical protein
VVSHQKYDAFFLFNFFAKKQARKPSQAKDQANPKTKICQKPSQSKNQATNFISVSKLSRGLIYSKNCLSIFIAFFSHICFIRFNN